MKTLQLPKDGDPSWADASKQVTKSRDEGDGAGGDDGAGSNDDDYRPAQ